MNMKIDLLDEVAELLRQKHIGGWQDFRIAYARFASRHCDHRDDAIDRMNRFWRFILSNTCILGCQIEDAMSSLCHSNSKREWLKNFNTYILGHINDINDALGDYRG